MPPRRSSAPEPAAAPGMGLALPEDIRRDLLRSQGQQITTAQRLPAVKMMPAAALLFEFADTQQTVREFEAVILNSHPRNILWDRQYGDTPAEEGGEAPACVSPDGVYGTPRPGFLHLGLSSTDPATGVERIPCETCPYNRWNSKSLLFPGARGKGKAVTNQKSIYLSMEDRQSPVELVLPPTSLVPFDQYLMSLTNQGVLMQAVVTTFRQIRKEGNGVRWAVLALERGRDLTALEFDRVLRQRQQYMASITPNTPPVQDGEPAPHVTRAVAEVPEDGDEDMPGF